MSNKRKDFAMKNYHKKITYFFATIILIFTCALSVSAESVESEATSSSATSGSVDPDIAERILSICNNAIITASDATLRVDLSECYGSDSDAATEQLLYDYAYIIGTSKFSEQYSGLSLSFLDDNFTAVLTVSEFKDVSDYQTNFFNVPLSETGATNSLALSIVYDKFFHNHDIDHRSAVGWKKLYEEYGMEYDEEDEDAKVEIENELWFCQSFDGANESIIHELQENTFVINYRYDMEDKFDYGASVGKDLNNALNNLIIYGNNDPDLLSFDTITLICFDGNSDNRLLEFQLKKTSEFLWDTTVNRCNDEFFKKGMANRISLPK